MMAQRIRPGGLRSRRILSMVAVALLAAPAPTLADELYVGANPSDLGDLTLVGLAGGTTWSVVDLETGAEVGSGSMDRGAVDEVDLDGVHRFAVTTSEPVLAYFGYDCCAVGGTTFLPTEDGHARVGRAFLLYLPTLGVQTDVAIFAIEEARVVIADLNGTVVGSREIEAGRAWMAYPLVGDRPYLIRSTGDVAVMVSAVNGVASVPPAGRADSCDNDVGNLFYFATHSWGDGGAAVFAYEDTSVAIRPAGVEGGEPVATVELSASEWHFFFDLGRVAYQLESTGDVAVWAGDLEGGETIEYLGDDFSANLGRRGLDVMFHSQTHGAVLFATVDETLVTLDGTDHTLSAGEWIDVEPGVATRAAATAPVVTLAFGGNDLNDWGGFLRPAPYLDPEGTCPDLDADLPGGDGDADADGDVDGDVDADADADADEPFADADGPVADADGPGSTEPRRSCDCTAAAPARSPSRLGTILRALLF